MYFCGSTVYQRIHVGNARAVRARDVASRWLRETGYEVKLVAEHHRHQRQGLRRPRLGSRAASSPRDATEWYLRGHRTISASAVPTSSRRRPRRLPRSIAMIAELVERGRRIRGRAATSTSASRAFPSTAGSRGQRLEQVEEQEPNPLQGGSARLRPLEGDEAGRGHVLGLAVGRRSTGLAHRVLGDVREASRAGVRDPRRRARSRLPAPRERDRAVARARPPFAQLWMHNGMLEFAGEEMHKSVGNDVSLRNVARQLGPRDAPRLLHDRALAQAARVLGRGRWRRRPRAPRGSARCSEARARRRRTDAWERFAAALDDDFNTPAALAVMHEWRDHELLRRALAHLRARVARDRRRRAAGGRRARKTARRGTRGARLRRVRPPSSRDRGGRLGRP